MQTIKATNLRKSLYQSLTRLVRDREPVEVVLGGQPVAVLLPSPGLPDRRRKPLIDLDAVSAFCRRHQVRSFALFGSILRDDFDEKSDVDVIVDLGELHISFRVACRMVDELESMFGRKVDMVERSSLPRINPHRRKSIEESARIIYEIS
jgi:hypothetical protein